MDGTPDVQGSLSANLYDVDRSDPRSELIDREHLSEAEIAEINRLMAALAGLRQAEDALTDASLKYMKLNKTDMRALHFLIVSQHADYLPKPREIAEHLGISTASTTKLLDRLEAGGHITRAIHPNDRRAQVISVTPHSRSAAMRTVGKQHAKRFHIAARLNSQERIRIAQFLEVMAEELLVIEEPWEEERQS